MSEKTLPFTVNEFKKQLEATVAENPEATIAVSEVIETFEHIKNNKGTRRGQLAGISLAEMTDEQLKREVVNANSVYYKAVKRGASDEIINKNKERLDAAIAERDARKAAATPATEEATEVESNDVYSTEEALDEL